MILSKKERQDFTKVKKFFIIEIIFYLLLIYMVL